MPNPHADTAIERFAAWLATAPLMPPPDTPHWPELRERARLNLQQMLFQMAADEQAEAEGHQSWGYTLG